MVIWVLRLSLRAKKPPFWFDRKLIKMMSDSFITMVMFRTHVVT